MKKFLLLLFSALAMLGCGETNNDFVASPIINPSPSPGNIIPPIGRLEFYLVAPSSEGRGLQVFRLDGSGTLSAVSGSPFAAGTSMVSAAFSPSGRFLFGAEAATGQLLGFRLDPTTGALTNLPGYPVASVGVANSTVAIDRDGDKVYVIGDSNIDGFQINQSTGTPTRLAGFPIQVPGLVDAWQGVFSSQGFLYVTDRGTGGLTGGLSIFRQNEATGALTLESQRVAMPGVTSLQIDESGNFLYVAGLGALYGFDISGSKVAEALAGFPVNFAPAPALSTSIAIKERVLYVGDVGGSLSAFRVASTGALTALAGYPTTGAAASVIGYDHPLTPYIYVTNPRTNQIQAFRVDANGNRTAVPGSPFATVGAPLGVTPAAVSF